MTRAGSRGPTSSAAGRARSSRTKRFQWKYFCFLEIFLSISGSALRRRSTYPAVEDFRCEGSVGPPCTVFREDTVTLDVDWNNPGIRDMSQSTHWVSWIDIPWVGMETEVCPYLDGGLGCGNSTVLSVRSLA